MDAINTLKSTVITEVEELLDRFYQGYFPDCKSTIDKIHVIEYIEYIDSQYSSNKNYDLIIQNYLDY